MKIFLNLKKKKSKAKMQKNHPDYFEIQYI